MVFTRVSALIAAAVISAHKARSKPCECEEPRKCIGCGCDLTGNLTRWCDKPACKKLQERHYYKNRCKEKMVCVYCGDRVPPDKRKMHLRSVCDKAECKAKHQIDQAMKEAWTQDVQACHVSGDDDLCRG